MDDEDLLHLFLSYNPQALLQCFGVFMLVGTQELQRFWTVAARLFQMDVVINLFLLMKFGSVAEQMATTCSYPVPLATDLRT